MLHPQNGHVPEPHCCHCSPAANGETDRPDLKLVPFVRPADASKRIMLARVGHIDLMQKRRSRAKPEIVVFPQAGGRRSARSRNAVNRTASQVRELLARG